MSPFFFVSFHKNSQSQRLSEKSMDGTGVSCTSSDTLYKWQWNQYLDKAVQRSYFLNYSIDLDYLRG